jgi:protein O-GlcNAc transferase
MILISSLFIIIDITSAIPDLPVQHLPFYLHNRPAHELESCRQDDHCQDISSSQVNSSCWGYEDDCSPDKRFFKTNCPGDSENWAKSKKEQEDLFFDQADFGYVKQIRRQVRSFCDPVTDSPDDSKLECSEFTKFCRGRNLFIDFRRIGKVPEPMRYRADVLEDGQIGGVNCKFRKKELMKEGGHKSPLQSWYEEIEHFTVRDEKDMKCDVVIEKPTYLMKLDATVNMYHHFCDFINLYLTFHVNNTFEFDNNILIWDTMKYNSNFGVTWKAFTDNEVMHLAPFAGEFASNALIVFFHSLPSFHVCRKDCLLQRHCIPSPATHGLWDVLQHAPCTRLLWKWCLSCISTAPAAPIESRSRSGDRQEQEDQDHHYRQTDSSS